MSSALNSKKTIVISAVVFILSLMPIESFADKDWELITQFPSKRLGFVTVVVDDEIYLIGGSLFEDIKPDKRMPGPSDYQLLKCMTRKTTGGGELPICQCHAQMLKL